MHISQIPDVIFESTQVTFPWNFASIFSAIRNNSSVLFLAQALYTLVKGVLRSKFVKFLMPILKRQVDSSPTFAYLFSFMKDNPPVLFLPQIIYTLLKRNLLKRKFLRLSKAQVKICQISYVIPETTSRFLSKFCIPLQFYER